MRRVLAIAVLISFAALVGCGGGDGAGEPIASGSQQRGVEPSVSKSREPRRDGAAASQGVTVKVAASQYGEILFDGEDQAIYLFDREGSSRSECYGACAQAWPPVLTEDQPEAGSGVDASLLGTTKRQDGTVQATYNGHPLYYYVSDPPGQVLCQNVEEFGGLWLVVDREGNAIR
jgi:predicted lipoprotein with Yx(FWY)xxD motif